MMMKNKNPKVEIIDDDHVFVDNRQFVSLKRFAQVKMDGAKEIKLLNDKNKELAKENEALRTLLWNKYHGVDDACSTQDDTTNKIVTTKQSLNDYVNSIVFDSYDTYLNTSNISDHYKNNFYISDYCKDCPNNPANGGDGVCNCAAGAETQITF